MWLTTATARSIDGTSPENRKEQQPSQIHAAQRDDRQRDGQQAGGDDRAGADIAADP